MDIVNNARTEPKFIIVENKYIRQVLNTIKIKY